MIELATADGPDVAVPAGGARLGAAAPRATGRGCVGSTRSTRAPLWPGPVSTWVTRRAPGLLPVRARGPGERDPRAPRHAATDLGHERISDPGASGGSSMRSGSPGRPGSTVGKPPRVERLRSSRRAARRGGARGRVRGAGRDARRRRRARRGLQRRRPAARRGTPTRARASTTCSSGGRVRCRSPPGRTSGACRMASCSRTIPSSRHVFGSVRNDVRRGTPAVPRARDDRVPERRHVRAAGRARREGPGRGARAGLERGRSGVDYFEETMALRAELRGRSQPSSARRAEQVALTGPRRTVAGSCCAVSGSGRATRSSRRRTSTSACSGRSAPRRRDVVVVPPDPERILAARHAPTRLIATSQVLWTRRGPTARRAPRAKRRAGARRRGTVGRRDPRRRAGRRLPHDLGPEVALRAGLDRRAGRRGPDRLAIVSPSYFAQQAVRARREFEPQRGARRFDPGWWSHGACCAGCWRRSRCVRTGGSSGRLGAAASCRGCSHPWSSGRAAEAALDPRRLPRRAERRPPSSPSGYDAGVDVREIPGREVLSRVVRLVDERRGRRAPRRRARGLRPAGQVPGAVRRRRRRAEPELARDRLQGLDHVRDVLVELEPDELGPRVDLVAMHARPRRRAASASSGPTSARGRRARRPHEPTGVDEAQSSSQANSVCSSCVSRGRARRSAGESTARMQTPRG